ncbi:MAG: hypothetical protein PHV37_01655 [Candidatus Gastranaerophilales bacterium]|nr:hypothetical protein [Candidatus Gastranaerophilales bacterium]
MQKLNKLQIRAKVLSVMSDLKRQKPLTPTYFFEQITQIKDIEDKETLFEILVKELAKAPDSYSLVLKATMAETVPTDYLKDKALEMLGSTSVSDELKYQLVKVLKDIGSPVDYDKFFSYFDDPDSILAEDTKKLLEFAIVNPETQIDFLDFLHSLPDNDKMTLINSLGDDYTGDTLANVLYPVLFFNFSPEIQKRALEIIGDTKSFIPLDAIEFLQKHTKDAEILSLCKKSSNLLKLSGATKEKSLEFYKKILKDSTIEACYTTMPDGHNNQAIIIGRARDDESRQLAAIVINPTDGIVDCFGFNFLTEEEMLRIIERFSKNEPKIAVSPEYCKTIINNALIKADKNVNAISYEFVCWSVLLKDIENKDLSISDYVKNNIEKKELSDNDFEYLFEAGFFDKWFFSPSDNQTLSKLLNDYISDETISLEKIEKSLSENNTEIWDKETLNDLIDRINNTAYLLDTSVSQSDAKLIASLCISTKQFEKLKDSIIKRSVYEFLILTKQNTKDTIFSTNIFRAKKNTENKQISLKHIEKIIKDIEMNWTKE